MTQKIDWIKELRCSENFPPQEQRQLEVHSIGIQQITYSWAENVPGPSPNEGMTAANFILNVMLPFPQSNRIKRGLKTLN